MSSATPRNDQTIQDIAFLFQVQTDEGSMGAFQAVENLQRTVQMHEYWEGGKNDSPHVLIGPAKYGEVTLKWGAMSMDYLYKWATAVEIGADFRKDITVIQLTRDGTAKRFYKIEGAWPIEWKGAAMDASQSNVPIEELRLACKGVTMEVVNDG